LIIENFFFDRDGVINVDTGYPYQKSEIRFINQTVKFLKYLTKKKKRIFIVSNQSGINRGYYTTKDFLSINTFFENYFNLHFIKIDKTYFCPHLPSENCICRKPNNGLIKRAIKEFNLNPKNSVMIGDKVSDIGDSALWRETHHETISEQNWYGLYWCGNESVIYFCQYWVLS